MPPFAKHGAPRKERDRRSKRAPLAETPKRDSEKTRPREHAHSPQPHSHMPRRSRNGRPHRRPRVPKPTSCAHLAQRVRTSLLACIRSVAKRKATLSKPAWLHIDRGPYRQPRSPACLQLCCPPCYNPSPSVPTSCPCHSSSHPAPSLAHLIVVLPIAKPKST